MSDGNNIRNMRHLIKMFEARTNIEGACTEETADNDSAENHEGEEFNNTSNLL